MRTHIAIDDELMAAALGTTGLKTRTATSVLAKGFSLLHSDRDFDAFETHLGLHVIH